MIVHADARQIPLRDGCVQCVVTSPPYWGLRDYGVAAQIGMESTPDAYVAALVAVFREVRRVLADDGVLWLNLGDSYATGGGAVGRAPGGGDQGARFIRAGMINTQPNRMPIPGLKPKDLVGIPWRVAFALQADGWYLRSDIIWSKPNPMPESVTDRPTKAHEYVFLLAKSDRYYYDADAISEVSLSIVKPRTRKAGEGQDTDIGTRGCAGNSGNRNARSVWTITTKPYSGAHFATMPEQLAERCIRAGSRPPGRRCDCDQIIGTPLGTGETVDPSLETGRAGYNRQRRADEGTRPITRREQRHYAEHLRLSPFKAEMATAAGEAFAHYIRTDRSGARPVPPALLADWLGRGWLQPLPDTDCGCPTFPGDLVLDPFGGSGTTAQVAYELNRRGVMLDLNMAYLNLAIDRTSELQPSLLEVAP